MNWGMPTLRAARRPLPSRMVALRSLDWFKMGVVAVRLTYIAISKQTVSMVPRMTSAGTGSPVPSAIRRSRGPARAFRSTFMVIGAPPQAQSLLTTVSPFTVHRVPATTAPSLQCRCKVHVTPGAQSTHIGPHPGAHRRRNVMVIAERAEARSFSHPGTAEDLRGRQADELRHHAMGVFDRVALGPEHEVL